jgi:hypothetical protein
MITCLGLLSRHLQKFWALKGSTTLHERLLTYINSLINFKGWKLCTISYIDISPVDFIRQTSNELRKCMTLFAMCTPGHVILPSQMTRPLIIEYSGSSDVAVYNCSLTQTVEASWWLRVMLSLFIHIFIRAVW